MKHYYSGNFTRYPFFVVNHAVMKKNNQQAWLWKIFREDEDANDIQHRDNVCPRRRLLFCWLKQSVPATATEKNVCFFAKPTRGFFIFLFLGIFSSLWPVVAGSIGYAITVLRKSADFTGISIFDILTLLYFFTFSIVYIVWIIDVWRKEGRQATALQILYFLSPLYIAIFLLFASHKHFSLINYVKVIALSFGAITLISYSWIMLINNPKINIIQVRSIPFSTYISIITFWTLLCIISEKIILNTLDGVINILPYIFIMLSLYLAFIQSKLERKKMLTVFWVYGYIFTAMIKIFMDLFDESAYPIKYFIFLFPFAFAFVMLYHLKNTDSNQSFAVTYDQRFFIMTPMACMMLAILWLAIEDSNYPNFNISYYYGLIIAPLLLHMAWMYLVKSHNPTYLPKAWLVNLNVGPEEQTSDTIRRAFFYPALVVFWFSVMFSYNGGVSDALKDMETLECFKFLKIDPHYYLLGIIAIFTFTAIFYFISWIFSREFRLCELDQLWRSPQMSFVERRILLAASQKNITYTSLWRSRLDGPQELSIYTYQKLFLNLLSPHQGRSKAVKIPSPGIRQFNLINIGIWLYAPVLTPIMILLFIPWFVVMLESIMQMNHGTLLDGRITFYLSACIANWTGWSLTYHLYLWLQQFKLIPKFQEKVRCASGYSSLNSVLMSSSFINMNIGKIFEGNIAGYIALVVIGIAPVYLSWLDAIIKG